MQSVFQEVLSLCNLFLNRRFSELSSQRYSQLSMEEKKKILEQLRFHKLYAILRSNIISELLETNEEKTYLHGNELLMAQNMHWKELTSIVNCLSNHRVFGMTSNYCSMSLFRTQTYSFSARMKAIDTDIAWFTVSFTVLGRRYDPLDAACTALEVAFGSANQPPASALKAVSSSRSAFTSGQVE